MTAGRRRIWVIGGDGFIGSYLLAQLRNEGVELCGTSLAGGRDLRQLDILDRHQVRTVFRELRPDDIVIHTAAQAHVDWCEQHPVESAAVNVTGSSYVADAVAQAQARLVYFSTDYVFDGRSGPYRETDAPAPLNVYGQQKLLAEHYVARHVPKYLIIRTTTVFGYEANGKNFLMSLIRRLRQQEEILVPSDQVSTPTYVNDLARIAADVAKRDEITGMLNVVGEERMSRLELGRLIAFVFQLDERRLRGVPTAELGQIAARPLSAGLSIDRLKALAYTSTTVARALDIIKSTYGNNFS